MQSTPLVCLIVGKPDDRLRAREFLESCDFFSSFIERDQVFADCEFDLPLDFVFLTDPEAEFTFLGSGDVPWIITWSHSWVWKFVSEDRVLRVPPERFPRDSKSVLRFRKLLSQTKKKELLVEFCGSVSEMKSTRPKIVG